MTSMETSVESLYRALANGDERAGTYLTEDVAFMTTSPTVTGRAAVVAAMIQQDGGLLRRIVWSAPETADGDVRIRGRAPAGEAKLGYIATLTFDGKSISCIRQQDIRDARMAGAVRQRPVQDPLKLPDELKQMIADARDKNPMLIACVDSSGQPVLSYRGSLFALSDDQLAMWIRNPEGALLTCITGNPKVALMYRDQPRKATFQFQGRARIARDAVDRERVFAGIPPAEQHHDYARVGVAVIIDLDLVEGYYTLNPGWTMLSMQR